MTTNSTPFCEKWTPSPVVAASSCSAVIVIVVAKLLVALSPLERIGSRPKTNSSIVSTDGDQPNTERQSNRLDAKLIRVANRVTNWITQGEKPSRVKPKTTSSG